MITLIRKVESVLFGAGRRLTLEHIAKLVKAEEKDTLKALEDLKKEYEEKDTSLRVTHNEEFWKLTVRDAFADTVGKLVTQTEFSKTVMETLAVIAYKSPVLQSEVIKIRTNKAYEHIMLLDEMGFLSRVKQGRSKLIRLSPKFYDYFDLPEDVVKARFAVVREKENEVIAHEKLKKELIEEIKKRKIELQQSDERSRKEHEEHIEKLTEEIKGLEVYGAKEKFTDDPFTKLEKVEDKVGKLDVYRTKSKEGTHWGDFDVYSAGTKSGSSEDGEEGELVEGGEGETAQGEEKEPDRGETPLEGVEIGENPDEAKEGKKEPAPLPIGEDVEMEALEQKEGEGMFAQGITEDVQKGIDQEIDTMLGKKEEDTPEKDTKEKNDVLSGQEQKTSAKPQKDASEEKTEEKTEEPAKEEESSEDKDSKVGQKSEPEEKDNKEVPSKTGEETEGEDLLSEPMKVKEDATKKTESDSQKNATEGTGQEK